MFELSTGKKEKFMRHPQMKHVGWPECAVFSPDGKMLVSVDNGKNGKLIEWEWAKGKPERVLDEGVETSFARRVAICTDGKTLASTTRDGVQLWDFGQEGRE